jgi:hypothetical protein
MLLSYYSLVWKTQRGYSTQPKCCIQNYVSSPDRAHIDKTYLCEHVDGGARQSLRFGGEKRLELAQRRGDGANARARAASVGGRV